MEYTQDEIMSTLDELMASKRVVDTSRGAIWFRFPLAEDKIYARHLYNKAKERYEEDGIPSMEEAKKEHIAAGAWDELKEVNMKRIPEFMEETKAKIKVEKNRIRKKKQEKWLQKLARLTELQNAYQTLMAATSEFMAYRESISFMVWKCFVDTKGEPLWDTYEDVLEDTDVGFIDELILIYGTNEEVEDQSLIRRIARDPQWRVRWKASAANINSLFGRASRDMTITQFMLVYWSQMYDSVFDSYDRPPMDVIEDDDALDNWLEKRSEEAEREIKQKFSGSSNIVKNSKIDNCPEVFKVVSGYYNDEGEFVLYSDEERWEQIEKTRDLNAPETRGVVRQAEKELAQNPKQFVPEQRLRKTERAIEATGGKVQVIQRKR